MGTFSEVFGEGNGGCGTTNRRQHRLCKPDAPQIGEESVQEMLVVCVLKTEDTHVRRRGQSWQLWLWYCCRGMKRVVGGIRLVAVLFVFRCGSTREVVGGWVGV